MKRPQKTIKVWMRKDVLEDENIPVTAIFSDENGANLLGYIVNKEAKKLGMAHVSRKDVGLFRAELTIAAGHGPDWGIL